MQADPTRGRSRSTNTMSQSIEWQQLDAEHADAASIHFSGDVTHDDHHERQQNVIEVVDSGDHRLSDDELQVQYVHRLKPHELRRQRMDAAREALRRAANRQPKPIASQTLFSSYKCPICLCPPKNLSVTPCGHIFCGPCLYDALSVNTREANQASGLESTASHDTDNANHLFTSFGSGGALALANAAGASVGGTRGLFHELVNQRRRQQQQHSQDPRATHLSVSQASTPMSATRLRASNGTERMKGLCPVCRSPIKGGFTGLGRKGILGLDIMVGTPGPATSSTPPPPSAQSVSWSPTSSTPETPPVPKRQRR